MVSNYEHNQWKVTWLHILFLFDTIVEGHQNLHDIMENGVTPEGEYN